VPVLFWGFRFMVGIGFFFIAFFALSFWFSAKRQFQKYRWYLRIALFALPLPWISSELGWVVAENGRQPWTIDGVLPTYLSVSSVPAGDVWFSLGGFALFYSLLAIVELYLMFKYIRLGPEKALGAPMVSPAVRT
jgi:cytochrome d ubiquinol oxidase subunit I